MFKCKKGVYTENPTLPSKNRADAVKQWLVMNGGIDTQIIATIGKGKSEPAAPNTNPDGSDNPKGRQKNRRVEIVIKKK